jgi:hypothetical protein
MDFVDILVCNISFAYFVTFKKKRVNVLASELASLVQEKFFGNRGLPNAGSTPEVIQSSNVSQGPSR